MYGNTFGYGFPNMQGGLGLNAPYGSNVRPVSNILKGHIVTNVDEAKAAQIDFDGSVSYFPCPAENRIYAKCIGMDGMPVFLAYEIQKPAAPVQYADSNMVNDLRARVEQLEKVMRDLGGLNNEPSNVNADVK